MKRLPPWLLPAVVVFALALSFALVTRHAWEDYWITFRTSRHFAEGTGLVFNPGERLHTFTSPLGVLLPAVAYWLTLNSSDYGALWIFRLMSALALGGAAALLYSTVRRRQWPVTGAWVLVALFALDAKTLDFAINGMETGFLLLFLAWNFYALFGRPENRARHLGLAWAGLMWTRPDSFIYIGVSAAGAWLFDRGAVSRGQELRTFWRAGLLTLALYVPWLVAAGLYYGTPVPHTIVAKGLDSAHPDLARVAAFLKGLPAHTWDGTNSFASTFLPSYYQLGGWPGWTIRLSAGLSAVLALLWLVPRAGGMLRALSLTFLVGHLYLSFATYFPFPWYVPTLTCCATAMLALLWHAAWSARPAVIRGGGAVLLGGLVLFSGWLTLSSARQLAAAQRLVEDGNRKQIGLYLRAHAEAGDTVFLEPLGYIGYFSQLETFDFPGMSSRKMVAARRRVGDGWADLINQLDPVWLVLRDHEVTRIRRDDASIFTYRYRAEKVFDASPEVLATKVWGRNYLEIDSKFTLWRRLNDKPFETPLGPARGYSSGTFMGTVDGREVMFLHSPAELMVDVPAAAKTITVTFGFFPKAYTEEGPKTDGANFQVWWVDANTRAGMWGQILRPATVEADRGVHEATIPIPAADHPRKLMLKTLSNETVDKDWTFWGRPVFH